MDHGRSLIWATLVGLSFRETLCESGEGVRLPRRKGLISGEVRGTSGGVWEISREPLDCSL